MHPLLVRLSKLALPTTEYAVFGSGPLLVRGIIDEVGDLDVLCRGAAWERVVAIGEPVRLEEHDVDIVEIDDGQLTFGTRWAIGSFDVDELIDTADRIDGLPFVRLDHVVAYKRLAGRPKDLDHLRAVERYDDRPSPAKTLQVRSDGPNPRRRHSR